MSENNGEVSAAVLDAMVDLFEHNSKELKLDARAAMVRKAAHYLITAAGDDPGREGMFETPNRVAKAWEEWTSGYRTDIASLFKVFEDGAQGCDEMVLLTNIPIYSHCEHHLAPFFGVAHVAYIPDGKVIGLSKLTRLADAFARRLQVQERMTNQIVDAMQEFLKPKGAAVIVRCRHMCMESRGVNRAGVETTTSALRGVLRTDSTARAELLSLIRQ